MIESPSSTSPTVGSAAENPTSRPVLIAAGLASLDGVLAVTLLGLWAFSPDTALSTIQAMSGLAFLLGIAPILVGGWILDRNRKSGGKLPGAAWARWAVLAGGLLTTVTILIPLTAAVSRITGGIAGG